jgi:hypothetical protein
MARRLDPLGARDRTRCLMWAFGALFPPAACAVLYETVRLARRRMSELGVPPRGGSLLLPPTLFVLLVFGLGASRAGSMLAPYVILLPIPFLLVQGELNELEMAEEARASAPMARRSWLPWSTVLLGLPLSVFVVHQVDGSDLVGLRRGRNLAASAVIEGTNPRFSLKPPSDRWEQVEPGVVGDGLERYGFRQRSTGNWVLVFVHEAGDMTLDDLVAARREVLREASGLRLVGSQERRTFLAGSHMVPLSSARHETVSFGNRNSFLTAGVIHDNHAVEVVGMSRHVVTELAEVAAFVMSLQLGGSGP